jgi:hypothetical protein
MPAFGCNPITIAFAEVVLEKERLVSGDGSEEDPYVYEKIGFRLTDRIVSALDRFIGALSRFRLANTQLMARWLFIYPFVGGVDWVHGLNLADVDGRFSKFAITWSGNVTHNANGILMATGASGNTNCDMANVATNLEAWNRRTHGIYSRTNTVYAGRDFTASFVEPRNGYSYSQGLYLRHTDGNCYGDLCYYAKTGVVTTPNRAYVAVGDSLGLLTDNQRSSTVAAGPFHYIYKRGVYIVGENSGEAGMGYGTGPPTYLLINGTGRNYAFFFSTKHKQTLEYLNLPGTNAQFYYFVQQLQVALLRAV